MNQRRLNKFERTLAQRQNNLTVILENVLDSHNIAAAMRSCDAVGIGEVYIIHSDEISYCKLSKGHPTGKKASGGVMKWVTMHHFRDTESCYGAVREKYDHIYTTHLSSDAVSLYDMDMTKSMAIVFGNELKGVSKKAVELADGNLVIPMMGMIPSLNISVACAVTLFEACRQRNLAGAYGNPTMAEELRESILQQWIEREEAIKRKNR